MRALLAPGRADPRHVRQRWLVRHGGAATEDARRAVVKLLVDAARQTSVERRILPWADIPIELGGKDVPLAVFEGDDPSQVRLAPAPRPLAAVD